MALDRARGNASDSWHTEPEHVGDSVKPRLWDKASRGSWYVAKSGSRSDRHYICRYALMVTSMDLIVGAGGDQG